MPQVALNPLLQAPAVNPCRDNKAEWGGDRAPSLSKASPPLARGGLAGAMQDGETKEVLPPMVVRLLASVPVHRRVEKIREVLLCGNVFIIRWVDDAALACFSAAKDRAQL